MKDLLLRPVQHYSKVNKPVKFGWVGSEIGDHLRNHYFWRVGSRKLLATPGNQRAFGPFVDVPPGIAHGSPKLAQSRARFPRAAKVRFLARHAAANERKKKHRRPHRSNENKMSYRCRRQGMFEVDGS